MQIKERLAALFAGLGRLIENRPAYCLVFFLVFFCVFYALKLDHRGVGGGDELGYLRAAYHLVHKGVMSDSDQRDATEPTARRAPGYPLFLAAGIRLVPALYADDFECVFDFKKGVPQEPEALVWLKRIQAVLLLATALMTGWLLLDITGRRVPAYWTLWFVGFHPFLERYANRLYAEVLGAFLITLLSVLVYKGLKGRKVIYLALAGVVLGYLTLTFAQWKLVGLVTLGSLFLYIVLVRVGWKRLSLGLTLSAVIWVSMFSYWEGRNEQITGHRMLSSGGGTVLQLRSLYDTMPWSAYWASFAYWSRSPLLIQPLESFVEYDRYAALNRDDPKGIYRTARAQRKHIGQSIEGTGEKWRAEVSLKVLAEAKERILANTVRHLLTTFPVAFRSMMNPTLSVLYIGVYGLFFMALYCSLKQRQWLSAVLLASPLGLFGFNWLVTHGLPRYSEQAAPLLILGAVLGYCCLKKKNTGKLADL